MKKIAAFGMGLLMLGALTGCTGVAVVNVDHSEVLPTITTIEGEGNVKIGLSIDAKNTNSVSASGETNGEIQYDVAMTAVAVDDEGVIRGCLIDNIAVSVPIDASGKILSNIIAEVPTEREILAGQTSNSAQSEWNESADTLAEYAVGKTVEELKNGTFESAKDAETGATMANLGVAHIKAAVQNARFLGAQGGDELRMAALPSLSASVEATSEQLGTAQLDADIAVIAMNGETITACWIDSVQAQTDFDAEGRIVSALSERIQTKNELGEAYGLKAFGGSQYEWNEQAAAFAAYVTGKTAAETAGIAVNERTAPVDADLSATVTIAIRGFKNLILKAAGR